MLLSEYIVMLQNFAGDSPDLPVCMTESGYYSEGEFADLFDVPEVKVITVTPAKYKSSPGEPFKKISEAQYKKFIVLGHSHQSY